jgi:HK97 family phage portal protein
MKISLPFIGDVRTGKDALTLDKIVETVRDTDVEGEQKFFDVLGGLLQFTNGALSNERTISRKILEANKEWVYRNNDVIAQEVSKIELQLFAVGLKSGEIVFDEVQEHPILDLLDKFNSTTTRMDGFYTTQSHKKLTGDAFWLLDRNGKSIENIFILPPDKVELNLGDPTDGTANLVESYTYKDNIDGKYIEVTYSRDDIIHFKKPNPKNPFRGYGAVEAIADTIDADNLTNLTQRNFFDKGAISNFVLTTDAKLTQDQIKRLRAEFRAMYSGAKNAFQTMIFGNGLKPASVGFSNKDMQFLDLLTWYRDKIMIGFGNTKASIGIIDDVNRASYDGSYAGWLRSTVKPDMDAIVATVNEFLVPLYGNNLVLGYKDPVPEDSTEDVQDAVQLKNAGIIKVNEAREMVGFDAVPDGDVFMPASSVGTPTDLKIPDPALAPPAPPPVDPNAPPVPEPAKRMRYRKTKTNLPPALAHMDVTGLLRRRKMFTQLRINREFKEAAKPMIRRVLNNRTKNEVRISAQFTNEQLDAYYAKQTNVVDVLEGRFEKAVLGLLGKVQEQALHNLDTEVGTGSVKRLKRFMVKKELFDPEQLKVQAQLDLTPILMQELILAGEEAYRLIGVEDTYIPYRVADAVKAAVDRFATSMLETDKTVLTNIIAEGIDQGSSVPEIRDNIMRDFGNYSKIQAERITRTEVMRASNMAAEDAFIQSGVVEAKQWLVAPGADGKCQPYSGKIIKLGGNFYEPDDKGFQDGNPPIHPNCRCVLIPIVVGTRGFEPAKASERELLQARIADLESQIDKRTRAFKEIQEQKADDQAYIKALEKHLGVDNE